MIRGALDESEKRINAQLPDIADLVQAAPQLSWDWNSYAFAKAPTIPIAGVCLHDAISTLEAARFAMFEALAHEVWYSQQATDVNHQPSPAWWYQRFFADDAVLRMYAVAEDMAEAIIYMLNVKDADLAPYKKRYTSQQTIVGNYLRKKSRDHELTGVIKQLASNREWRWTRVYRDRWVHEQPPLMEGFGIRFKRKPRWQPVEGASVPQKTMYIGSSGDPPDYTVEQLVTNARGALTAVAETTRSVSLYFVQVLRARQEEDSQEWGTGPLITRILENQKQQTDNTPGTGDT
jgi:hypothetical protein